MYKLKVQLLNLEAKGDPVIHELISKEFETIQEAFESFNGKEAYDVYLAIEEDILESINAMKEKETKY